PRRRAATSRRSAAFPSPESLGRVPLSGVGVARPSLFFDLLGMALMSRHYIDFVAFDRAGKRHRGPAIDDPLAELSDHRPGVVLVDVELLGDLQAGEVQPHQVQAGDPGSQRPVVAGEDRAGEVVEASPAGAALVALAVRLGVVPPVLDHRSGAAMRTGDLVGPAHRPDRLVTLGVVDQVLDVHHWSMPRFRAALRGWSAAGATARTDCND